MRIISLDASNWKEPLDFYDAILPALGAPSWHGCSVDALLDTMIWGDFNQVKPPYIIEINHTKNLPAAAMQELIWTRQSIVEARAEHQERKGYDVDVDFRIKD